MERLPIIMVALQLLSMATVTNHKALLHPHRIMEGTTQDRRLINLIMADLHRHRVSVPAHDDQKMCDYD